MTDGHTERALSEGYPEPPKYRVEVTPRVDQGQRVARDYHAKITRVSDGVELIRIRRWSWRLKMVTTRRALDRLFDQYDKDVERIRSKTKEFDR